MKRVLIVEGNADVFFFDALLRVCGLEGKVEVSPPASVKRHNGKFHAIATLDIFVKQLLDESIDRLAIALDADSPLEDQARGLKHTLAALDEKMGSFNFKRTSVAGGGYVYKTQTRQGAMQVHAWVMPDSNSDGTIEDFIRLQVAAIPEQAAWYERAKKCVAGLKDPMFNRDSHELKATTSTWLAWQRYPGKGMQSVVGNGLIDLDNGAAAALRGWLGKAFQ